MKELPVKKNQELTVTVDAVTGEGAGIGRVSGYAVFVPGALPGEKASVRIIKTTAGYAVGKLLSVLEASRDRVEPPCPYYPACGGCTLQHVSYEKQLEIKRQDVSAAMTRIGGVQNVETEPTIGMADPFRYRNKGAFPFAMTDRGLACGFFAPRSHRLIPIEDCLIEKSEVMDTAARIADWARECSIEPYDETTGKGVLRHGVARVTSSGQTMAIVVTAGPLPKKDKLLSLLANVESVYHNVNSKPGNVIFGDTFTLLKGPPVLEEKMGELTFRVGPRSFLQVNPLQTLRLYKEAVSLLSLQKNETVADVYCGVGTLSLLAAKEAKEVLGIESVPEAVENAKENARLNGISNASFLCGPAEEVLPDYVQKGGRVDALLVDPPRKGCEERVLQAILSSGCKRMVYVSCNPSTLARDVKLLIAGGFAVQKIQPVDMFPFCGHVETVCLMSRVKGK